MSYPSEHQLFDPFWVKHAPLGVQKLLPLVQRSAPGHVRPGSELHTLQTKTTTEIHLKTNQISYEKQCVQVFSYASDELKAGLVFMLRRQSGVLSGAGVRHIRRFKGCLKEISDFGKTAKSGGVRVMDKPLKEAERKWNYKCGGVRK